MSFLKDTGKGIGGIIDQVGQGIDPTQINTFEGSGFIVPPIPNADGTGLPSSKIPYGKTPRSRRHIIHFFVPEVGVVNMYVNPESINYSHSKAIQKERTKGGFSIQYWGEELPTIRMTGTTGSSGVEGLNVLYEIYRSEQLTYDAVGLSLASNNSLSGLGDLIDGFGRMVGQVGGGSAASNLGGSLTSSLTNAIGSGNSLAQSMVPRNPPTLAALATSLEMYYAGWVFRGYFTAFNYDENVNKLGTFSYTLEFTVTQRRGYRVNNFDFQRAANQGPSNNGPGGIPLSFRY